MTNTNFLTAFILIISILFSIQCTKGENTLKILTSDFIMEPSYDFYSASGVLLPMESNSRSFIKSHYKMTCLSSACNLIEIIIVYDQENNWIGLSSITTELVLLSKNEQKIIAEYNTSCTKQTWIINKISQKATVEFSPLPPKKQIGDCSKEDSTLKRFYLGSEVKKTSQ